MKKVVVWFRRDLRLDDNPALNLAISLQAQILPIYIHSPEEEAPWYPGGASRWWLHHSLRKLEQELSGRGLALHYFVGNARDTLASLVCSENIDAVIANRLYEPHLARRDEELFGRLSAEGIQTNLFDSSLLFRPGSILNKQGKPYRVFTPFWRSARRHLEVAVPPAAPALPAGNLQVTRQDTAGCGSLEDLGLLDNNPWHEKLHSHWEVGERAAQHKLGNFLDTGIGEYKSRREFPALKGSSRLSPHLHFGEITPGQIYRSLEPLLHLRNAAERSSVECLLSELGWREFAYQVLWNYPQTSRESMNPRFHDDFWKEDTEALHAWQHGTTGIDLVDAGMRELWETGWMHNRVRMVTASFLTKNLGLHWLHGARWFWDTLVDADLASNTLGWQWVAGCGVDAAPYYRIFNPLRQAKKFDSSGIYIDRWITGRTCSPGLVDLEASRREALERYKHAAGIRDDVAGKTR